MRGDSDVDVVRSGARPSFAVMVLSARELIFGRPDRLKVFVSSKMAGGALNAERRASRDVIDGFPTMRAWLWERDAVAGTFYSEEECVGNAATSDALVLILEDELTPVTRKEYRAAKHAGSHRIILLRTGIERSAELRRFIERERRHDAVTASYANTSELATRLFQALRELGVRPVRERMLRLRQASRSIRAYDELDICVGQDEESLEPLSAAIDRARRLASEDPDEALAAMYDFAEQALEVGLVEVARHLLEDLRDIVPPTALDALSEGWVLNLEGRALSGAGDYAAAKERFDRMRQLGRSMGDLGLESTALQNLGVQEVLASNYDEAAKLFRSALELKQELGDSYGALQLLLNQVSVLAGLGRVDAAHVLLDDLEQLIQLARLPQLRVSLLGQRALLLIDRGEFDGARSLFLQGLRIARRLGLPDRELTTLRNLASLDRDRSAVRQSLAWGRKGIALAESLGDRVQEEALRRVVGVALYDLGQVDEAVLQFVAAAELAEEFEDGYHHAESLGNAAACLIDAGRPQDAIAMLDTALAGSATADDDWRAGQLGNLAAAYSAAGDSSKAIETLEQAANLTADWTKRARFLRQAAITALENVALADRAADLLDAELEARRANETGRDWAWAAAEMGSMLSHTSQSGHARRFFTASLRVFAAVGDLQRSFMVRNDRAIVAAENEDFRSARHDLRVSLDTARRLEDRALQRQALLNRSEIERRAGSDGLAEACAAESLALARELEEPTYEADALIQMGLIQTDRAELDAAERTLKEAVQIARRASDRETQAHGSRHLGHVAFLRGRFVEAAKAYRRALRLMPEEPTAQRAEAIGGVILADAQRGRLDAPLVQDFVDVSQATGWERSAAEELFESAGSLLLRRRPSPAAELLALSLVLELEASRPFEEIPESVIVRVVQLIVLSGETRQPAFARKLRGELRRHLSSGVFDSLIDTSVEVARENRAETGRRR
jgi:tetratricopeptide (TPR) repeat protein